MIVYYANYEYDFNTHVSPYTDPPVSVLKRFKSRFKNSPTNLQLCPAITDYLHNMYAVTSPIDYSINVSDSGIDTDQYDLDFFNKHIIVRDKKLISIACPHLFFFAEKPLLMSQLPAYLENTNIQKYCSTISGQYDIGKHLRGLELPLIINEDCTISLKENDPLYYLKFHTSEKIIFKKFIMTQELLLLSQSLLRRRNLTKSLKQLNWYYDIVMNKNYRKKYLKLIKNHLIE